MIALGLLLALASPSRAQLAPAPVAQVRPDNLDEVFRRFASGRPMIPTLKEVQADRLKRDLAPRKESAPSAGAAGLFDAGRFDQPPLPGVRRETNESVDAAFSRPLRRVELGTGVSQHDVYAGNRHLEGETAAYGFIRLDLSKIPLARKLFHSPTAIHTLVEAQDDRVRVSKDEYTTAFLKRPH